MDLFRRFFSQPGSKPPEKPAAPETELEKETTPLIPPTQAASREVDAAPVDTETNHAAPPSPGDGATRPLPPETVISSSNEHLRFGQSTDVGMVRNANQDSVFSLFTTSRSADQRPDFGLFIVADGMGGHHDGEKASAMAAQVVASSITANVCLPMLRGENDADRMPVTEAMIAAVQKANADIIARVPEGGTTLTAVAIINDLAYIVHVGDSRIYLITKDGLEKITRDHSLVQRLVELDQITPEEALNHNQRNVLYRALGQSENVEVDALTRRLPPKSKLLLCSDGLWNMVNEEEISEIVMKFDNPQEACDKLVALANTHGGTDNITAIVLQIPG
ncbi:MAG: Stp1/IreP family PP2C-type Ser/Thr phosphatase [Chloroflexi bacterium]|nr:Stp1/IreP family PP2C-type Ser/Thr phosphatase [Chloroflexota bacterium]